MSAVTTSKSAWLLLLVVFISAGCAHDRIAEVRGLSHQDVLQIRALVRARSANSALGPPEAWSIDTVYPPDSDGTVEVVTRFGRSQWVYWVRKYEGRWTIYHDAGSYLGLAEPPANERSRWMPESAFACIRAAPARHHSPRTLS